MIQGRQSRPTHVVVEAQGHFVRLSCKGADAFGGGKRKSVSTFSPASRKRLLEAMGRLVPESCPYPASMISLTYNNVWPDPKGAKRDLFTFWKRVRRVWPQSSAIWRLEFQKRGAPHFHLIYFGPFFGKHLVQLWWGEVIGQERPFTRIEALRNWRHGLAYVAKYLAKVPEVPAECAVAGGPAEGGDGAARDSGLDYVRDVVRRLRQGASARHADAPYFALPILCLNPHGMGPAAEWARHEVLLDQGPPTLCSRSAPRVQTGATHQRAGSIAQDLSPPISADAAGSLTPPRSGWYSGWIFPNSGPMWGQRRGAIRGCGHS